jgi:hypothetical protein
MKIYFDISHIVGWKGNLTGIERVEYHLIKHYYENTDAEFIYWTAVGFVLAHRKYVEKNIVLRTSEGELDTASEFKKRGILKRLHAKVLPGDPNNLKLEDNSTVIIPAGLWDNLPYIEGVLKLAVGHKIVHVVYDMIPILQRGFVVDYLPAVFENYMYKILPECNLIMSISSSTAKDTKQVLQDRQLRVPPIKVFRLGDDISRAKQAQKPKAIDSDFILSVGTIEARKNYQLLYYTYKSLAHSKISLPKIVIVGKRGWLTADLQYMIEHDQDTKAAIKILDNTTDSELRWLYENCLFTVFPSFYEGWGLPVAESLLYGKVSLSSSTSSMPEVGAACADYFSPYSITELAKLITTYQNEDIRIKREKYIVSNFKLVLWDDASVQFAEKVSRYL